MLLTSRISLHIVLLALLCYTEITNGRITTVIDDGDNSIESVAQVVCETTKGTGLQIGRLSTIVKLVDFLKAQPDDNKVFRTCRRQHLEPLEELNNVLSTANDDACGEQKLGLIESYHRSYVSRLDKHKEAPKVANLLFMRYASHVSSKCEQAAVEVVGQSFKEISPGDLERVNKMKQFTEALGMSDLSKGYDSVYLFWNMVDSLRFERNEKFARYLSRDSQTRINVRMQNAQPLRGLQALCRYKFAPIYSKSILPVLRLVDMGYYPESNQLIDAIARDPSLFILTQICETLKPVRLFSDSQMAADKIVAITLEDAYSLPEPTEVPAIEELRKNVPSVAAKPVSLAGLEELKVGLESTAQIKSIKSTVKARGKTVRRILKNLVTNLKGKLRSKINKLFLAEKGQEQDLETIIDSSLDGSEMFEDEDNSLSKASDSKMERRKRSVWGNLKTVGSHIIAWTAAILYVVYFVVLFLIKLAILFVPTLVNWYLEWAEFFRKGQENSFQKGLGWLWMVGWDPRRPWSTEYDFEEIFGYKPPVD